VTYSSAANGVKLAGTLTLPKGDGPFPAVIFISGSGPQDRDESLLGHKPFLVIADHPTRKGIAVLRFDDRGTAKSTGDHAKATSADFAEDVLGGIAFLKSRGEIDAKKIGLIGHSEGGLIAPLVAVKSNDVAFIVLLAGTGLPGLLVDRASSLSARLRMQTTRSTALSSEGIVT
jgi:dienelactone hydrolase